MGALAGAVGARRSGLGAGAGQPHQVPGIPRVSSVPDTGRVHSAAERARAQIGALATTGLDLPTFSTAALDVLTRAVPFSIACLAPGRPGDPAVHRQHQVGRRRRRPRRPVDLPRVRGPRPVQLPDSGGPAGRGRYRPRGDGRGPRPVAALHRPLPSALGRRRRGADRAYRPAAAPGVSSRCSATAPGRRSPRPSRSTSAGCARRWPSACAPGCWRRRPPSCCPPRTVRSCWSSTARGRSCRSAWAPREGLADLGAVRRSAAGRCRSGCARWWAPHGSSHSAGTRRCRGCGCAPAAATGWSRTPRRCCPATARAPTSSSRWRRRGHRRSSRWSSPRSV